MVFCIEVVNMKAILTSLICREVPQFTCHDVVPSHKILRTLSTPVGLNHAKMHLHC